VSTHNGRHYFSHRLSIPISIYRMPCNVVFLVRVFSYKIYRELHRRHSLQKVRTANQFQTDYRHSLPDLSNFKLQNFRRPKKNCNSTSFEMRTSFFLREWQRNEWKVVEEYYWAVTQAVGRSCCDRSGSSVSLHLY
jgi:hypothetical protein